MKTYRITVNGKAYDVSVEDLGSNELASNVVIPKSEVKAAPALIAPAKKVEPKPKAAPVISESESTVTAPMPGTILEISVSEGDVVESGQALLILEAMKLENEIVAPSAGTITSVVAEKGASVNSGETLIVIGTL